MLSANAVTDGGLPKWGENGTTSFTRIATLTLTLATCWTPGWG